MRALRERDEGLAFSEAELACGLAGEAQTRRLFAIEERDLPLVEAADAGDADADPHPIAVGPGDLDVFATRDDLLEAFRAEQRIPDLLSRRRDIDPILPAQATLQHGSGVGFGRGGRRRLPEHRVRILAL